MGGVPHVLQNLPNEIQVTETIPARCGQAAEAEQITKSK
jgi:hypothetical protein